MKEMCWDEEERKQISVFGLFVEYVIVLGLIVGAANEKSNLMMNIYPVLIAINILAFLLPISPRIVWVCGERTRNEAHELPLTVEGSRIGFRQDKSNPLFMRGLLVPKSAGRKRDLPLFSEVKTYRLFQKMLIVQTIAVMARICAYSFYEIRNPGGRISLSSAVDFLIVFWIIASYIVISVTMRYYARIINTTRKEIFEPLCKKNIFWDFCQDAGSRVIELAYRKPYDYYTLKCGTSVFDDSYDYFYTDQEATVESEQKNIEMEVREDRKKFHTQILIQAYFHELREEHLEEINRIFKKMIQKELRDQRLPLVRPCLTCLIYVDVDSETFRKVVCRELQQQKEMICLYAGVVHEKRKAYISGQKGEYGQEEYQQMKEVVLKIFQKQELYEPW